MIETGRLRLRPWREDDRPAFARLFNTPAMMALLGGVQPPAVVDATLNRRLNDQARNGCCYWAVEWRETGELVGSCGIRIADDYGDAPIAGMPEIGWRIVERYWGQGIAREAAEASIAWGWANLSAPAIGAWTTDANTRSWGLMQRLGMIRRGNLDFHHVRYAQGDPAGAMIVYTLDRPS